MPRNGWWWKIKETKKFTFRSCQIFIDNFDQCWRVLTVSLSCVVKTSKSAFITQHFHGKESWVLLRAKFEQNISAFSINEWIRLINFNFRLNSSAFHRFHPPSYCWNNKYGFGSCHCCHWHNPLTISSVYALLEFFSIRRFNWAPEIFAKTW